MNKWLANLLVGIIFSIPVLAVFITNVYIRLFIIAWSIFAWYLVSTLVGENKELRGF